MIRRGTFYSDMWSDMSEGCESNCTMPASGRIVVVEIWAHMNLPIGNNRLLSAHIDLLHNATMAIALPIPRPSTLHPMT